MLGHTSRVALGTRQQCKYILDYMSSYPLLQVGSFDDLVLLSSLPCACVHFRGRWDTGRSPLVLET